MSTAPYEIIAGPADLWVAPVGETFPDVDDAPAGGWVALGDTEGGVKAKHSQSIELLRTDQSTGPVKAIRSEEMLEISTNLAHLTLENFAYLLNRVTVGTSYGDSAATLTTALAGANNDLLFTAQTAGEAGNDIRIRYVVAGLGTALSVAVVGNDITVNVATDGGGAATSTAAQVDAALAASGPTNALIAAANAPANDGTGVVVAFDYTNLASGADAKDITLYQGMDATTFALLVRGPSPYGDFELQYEVPFVVQTDEPEAEFVRDNKAVLAAKFCAIEDPEAASADERFGRMVAQTA